MMTFFLARLQQLWITSIVMKKKRRKKNPNSYSEGDLLVIEHAKFISF